MPQFDILTLGSQTFWVGFFTALLYYYSVKTLLPLYVSVKKTRMKKLKKNSSEILKFEAKLKKKNSNLITKNIDFLS